MTTTDYDAQAQPFDGHRPNRRGDPFLVDLNNMQGQASTDSLVDLIAGRRATQHELDAVNPLLDPDGDPHRLTAALKFLSAVFMHCPPDDAAAIVADSTAGEGLGYLLLAAAEAAALNARIQASARSGRE